MRTKILFVFLAVAIGAAFLSTRGETAPYWPADAFRGETFTADPLRWRAFDGGLVQRPSGWGYRGVGSSDQEEVKDWFWRMMAWQDYAGMVADAAFRRLSEFRDAPGGSARAYSRPPCRTADPNDNEPEPCKWRMALPPSGREPLKPRAGEFS